MRILFMGTPEIASVALSALAKGGYTPVGAVCQPDKPAKRGMLLTPPPVKVTAESLGIPVYQPETLKDGALLPVLEQMRPDLIVVVAYGKILPRDVLSYPKHGCINLHVSLLPKYRGAAPMQRAIMAGECETGVTVMQMDEGLDTGDILLMRSFPIGEEDDLGYVHDTSAAIGGTLLCEAVRAIEDGTVTRTKQPEEGASCAPKITKEECKLDFTKTAKELANKVRALSPVPLAYTRTPDGRILKVVRARATDGTGEAGRVVRLSDAKDGEIVVACGEGALALLCVVPEGKGKMRAADLIRGRRVALGDLLGGEPV